MLSVCSFVPCGFVGLDGCGDGLLLVGGRGWLVLSFAACACACACVCCVVPCHVVCRASLLVICCLSFATGRHVSIVFRCAVLCCSVLLRAVAVVVAGFLLVIGVSSYAVSVALVLSYCLRATY